MTGSDGASLNFLPSFGILPSIMWTRCGVLGRVPSFPACLLLDDDPSNETWRSRVEGMFSRGAVPFLGLLRPPSVPLSKLQMGWAMGETSWPNMVFPGLGARGSYPHQ
jgi:hypothetical protein